MKKFTSPGLQDFTGSLRFLTMGLLALVVSMAQVGRAQTNFASAQVLSGYWGSVTNDNTGVTADIGTPNIAGFAPNAPLWYQWTAPEDGVVTLDTVGSFDDASLEQLDTVLAVYTGTTLTGLSQIAANDNLFPIDSGSTSQGALNFKTASTTQITLSGNTDLSQLAGATPGGGFFINSFIQPYYGPSGLRFNAKAGQTYYFAADSKHPQVGTFNAGTGGILLNWAYKPSGVFRFAGEDVDLLTGMLLYQTAQTESTPPAGRDNSGSSAILTYYNYNAPGVLVTVTRTAGSTGRATVDYSTFDGTNLPFVPFNDTPAVGESSTNITSFTNIFSFTNNGNVVSFTNVQSSTNVVAGDFVPVSGTLVFDDFEMSKTILIPITARGLVSGDQTNRVFGIQLISDGGVTSPLLDPLESDSVSPPRVDPKFSSAMIRILNVNADPYGPDTIPQVVTNNGVTVTNMVISPYPTNVVFNFQKANFRVPADVNDGNVSPWTQVTLWVERGGTNNAATTVNYRVNNILGNDQGAQEEQNILFPLQPGSDYAVPSPPNWSPIRGTNSDFVLTSGSISFPDSGAESSLQPITFTVPTSTLTKFNKDFKVQLYRETSINNRTVPILVGMVNEATVTILFNDQNPPAGSVDEMYNADFNSKLALYAGQVPITSPPDNPNPGVGIYGQVYCITLLTNNEALIGGDFASYNGYAQGDIALINTNGSLDTSFNIGTGANGAVNAIVSAGNQLYVGGSFTSINGNSVGQNGGIARLNADGSFDGSFVPGLGPDGTVRTLAVLTNGEVLIGGDFTHFNGNNCNYIALINTNGTVDGSFNPSSNITGPVYTLALQGNQVMIGGNFSVAGQIYKNIARLNLNGSIDTSFSPGTGADGVVHSLAWQTNNQIVLGGEFTHINGISINRVARLNANGSLDVTGFFPGIGADDTVYSITQQADGTYYIGGAFSAFNGTHRRGFARLYSNGTVDTTFMDTAYNQFAGLKRIFSYDLPAVFASAVQVDGNVLIGGSFNQVGGGQANTNVCNTLDDELYISESFDDQNLWVEPKTRDGVRNRSGFARLIGGVTPGPGNFGFNQTAYSANKSQSTIPNVSLVRANGNLGPVSANFSVQSGTALNGRDYAYSGAAPLDWVASQYLTHPSRERSDGLFGQSGFLIDPYGLSLTLADSIINSLSVVSVSIINNKQSSGNLNAQFQLANPSLSDMFYLGGQEIPVGAALGISSASLALVDDTANPGVFGFSSPVFIATNSSTPISVLRTNATSLAPVSMTYSTANGTAVAGTDYTGISGKSLVFGQNIASNGFPITILNNGNIYTSMVEKTINLKLANLGTTPGATFGLSNAVVRIINPNFQGYVTLSSNNYIGTISSGVLNFNVNRISGSLGTLTVQYTTTNGSAINGTDYIGTTNTLTWNSGDVSPRSISIPLLNPGIVGTNKQFNVLLSNPTLNNVSAPSLLAGLTTNATLTISNDNNYGTIQFSAPSYTVNENGGYATITAVRTGGIVGAVSANYAATAGSNTLAGVNFTATNGVLLFAANQSSASFIVPVINDGVVDPATFYFNVTLSNPTNAALGSLTNAAVNLVDVQAYNRPPGLPDTGFNAAGMNGDVLALALQTNGQILAGGNFTSVGSINEGRIARLNTDGSLDAAFLNGLSGASAAVNALVCQTDGRILVGGAFAFINGVQRNFIARLMVDGSLDTSFNPGSGANNIVTALAETFVGGNRKIYVGGAFANINNVISPGFARLNNDGTPDNTFFTGTAADGQINAIAVYPTNSVYAGKVLIGGTFTHFNGVALNNLARLNVDGSVDTNFTANFGTGPGAAVFALAIQSDGRVLVGGDFTNFNGTTLNHVARLNVDGTMDTNFMANVTVGANDSVQDIALQPDNRIVLVGAFTQFGGVTRSRITRLLSNGATDPTINFGSGANGNVDAVVIQPDGMLVIGGSFNKYDDQAQENIARVYGGSETGSGQFQFDSANYQVDESGVMAPITIRRNGGTSGTNVDGSGHVFVTISTSDGTARAGTNYTTVVTSVDFPPGEVLKTVNIPVMDDHVITPNLTVNLALSNPTPPTVIGNQPTATLTILNDDSAVSFSSTYYSQVKNAATGVAVIDVIRQGGTNDIATVDFYTTTNGTAVIGTDYYPTNLTVTFNPGQADVQVQVPIINNGLIEGNTTVTMLLTNAINTLLVAPSNSTLTIVDTTPSPGRLSFTATNYTAAEASGTANLTVVRTNGSTGSVSVHYATVPGTAQPNINYVAVTNGTLTFANGQTTGTIPITLVQNNLVQGPVNLSVVLFNPSGGALLIDPTNTTVTIVSDNYGVSFLNGTNYVSETNSVGSIFVQRIGDTNAAFQVSYATVDGTAVAGVNYQTTTGTLSFASGEVLKTVSVPLINNQNVTNLTFGMTLSNPTAGASLAIPTNALIVLQGGRAGLSFTNAATTVAKNSIGAVIAVVCSNPGIEPVVLTTNDVPLTVVYSTVDGTAQAGVNYVATTGTLTFTNGIGTNYFTVPIINNSLIEGNRTFTVNLSNPSFPGKLVSPATQQITIIDGNVGMSFSSPTYTVLKSGITATITVLRTDNTNTTSTVNFGTADGTAVAGLDYTPTNGTFVFTNGETSKTFPVRLIANNTVQPDKTVLLQLSSPSNAFLIAPSAATLTIHDTSGSLVVPAGSALVSESFTPANGIIDPNERVSLLFGFRASGGTNINNVSAALLATNGIASPTGPQNYGTLVVGGPSTSRQFSFTANGTNSQPIAATFQISSGGNNIGTAVFTYTLGTWTATYYNTNPIIINDYAIATPYPSIISVTNIGGVILKATMTMTNISHHSPSDIDVLLVSPAQKDTLIMANAGGQNALSHVTLTFDDAATNSLPLSGQIISGTNKPTAFKIPVFP